MLDGGVAGPIGKKFHRSRQGLAQAVGRGQAHQARAGLRVLTHIAHRVHQSAHAADDRYRAVSLRIHLVEAARFEERWHQEKIAAGLDEMAHGLVAAGSEGDFF